MTILLTGGGGKTSTRMTRFLQDAKVPFLLASRRGEAAAPAGMQAVKFDFLDSSTYGNPFRAEVAGGENISAVYLVSPDTPDPVGPMNAFIDFAVDKGVKRFVMLAGTSVSKGGFHVGKVWGHLDSLNVEYCVLRATWFMENISERHYHSTIKEDGKLYTATGDGKIPFISATDIAHVAFHALTASSPPPETYLILGPELLSYDEVAAKLSHGLGRKIEHVKITQEESAKGYVSFGVPENVANMLAGLEAATASGGHAIMNDDVQQATSQRPQTYDTWIQDNKHAWD